MPTNVELKARIADADCLLAKAKALAESHVVFRQTDSYFRVPFGRLKLRESTADHSGTPCLSGELIFYDRADVDGPKLCKYEKQTFQDHSEAVGIKKVLATSLGIKAVVTKTRHLLIVGQTRVHVDTVQNLGNFMELEVMLKENQTTEEGQQIANDLRSKLGVDTKDFIECSYVDLLLQHMSNEMPSATK
uniref:Putative adenylate cyclase n=1 Tax=Ornithodoros turicata TaxID=34597 RepID=A0A2R5LJ35_9ACAR